MIPDATLAEWDKAARGFVDSARLVQAIAEIRRLRELVEPMISDATLAAVIRKCEQYWNEPVPEAPEFHAILEFIHREASAGDAEIRRLREEVERLGRKADEEMLRAKACEHIADGEEGWERLRDECPSTAAVAGLRDALARLEELDVS